MRIKPRRKFIACGSLLTGVLILSSCGGSGTPTSSLPATSRAGTTSQSSSAPPVPSPTPTTFTSRTYGYTVALPAQWTSVQAGTGWNGSSGLVSDSPGVDQFIGTYLARSWGVAAPWKQGLATYAAFLMTRNARHHGDSCPSQPATRSQITVGGQTGVLLAYNCGIIVAATVHHGVGYWFGFRNPTVHAVSEHTASDPSDQAVFMQMLQSVRFAHSAPRSVRAGR
jgi:hypothetical protein